MYSSLQLVSCMIVAASGLRLKPSVWSKQKKNRTITVVPQPAAGYAIDRRNSDEADDSDDENLCVICQSSLAFDTMPSLRHSPNDAEMQLDSCCDVIVIKEITNFPESQDVEPWNVRLSCGHVYHRQCIKKWFEKKTTCPLCNKREADVVYETVVCGHVIERYISLITN